jgi:RHS repeat-associated protein
MTYDALDRMVTQQQPFGMALTYTLDAVGNVQVVNDSLGGITSSAYDAANRLTLREFGGTSQTPLRVDLTYTARDQLASVKRSSDLGGVQTVAYSAYTYDSAERLTNLQHQNSSGNLLANFTYTYDQASRTTSQVVNGSTTSYSYDSASEVTAAGPAAYSYDLNGNRTMTGYSTGTANQLTSDGTWTYSYDNEGNLTKKTKGSSAETWTYGYDNMNRMIWAKDSATDGGAVTTLATYVYDAFGNRIEKDVWTQSSGTTTVTRFAYDGQNVWADLNGSNALQTRYLRGDTVDQLFARISAAGTAAWYLTDWEGSVRNITDNSGNLQDTISYDAFGNVSSESNSANGDRYRYSGRELDAETGLQFNRARYYDGAKGRWTSQDPLSFAAGDTNLYRYVGNSPTNARDPLGLHTWVDPQGGGSGGAPTDIQPRNPPLFKLDPGGAVALEPPMENPLPDFRTPPSWTWKPVFKPPPYQHPVPVSGWLWDEFDNRPKPPRIFIPPYNSGLIPDNDLPVLVVSGWLGLRSFFCFVEGTQVVVPTLSPRKGADSEVDREMAPFAPTSSRGAHEGTALLPLEVADCGRHATTTVPLRTKSIETIVPGDLVLAQDETTGVAAPMRVTHAFRRPSDHLRVVALQSADGKRLHDILTTDEHPFWVNECGWVPAKSLTAGDRLLVYNELPAVVLWTRYEHHSEGVAVYNIEVDGFHTYFVAGDCESAAVLVHNKKRLLARLFAAGRGKGSQAAFPKTPAELDGILGTPGTRIPDGPTTPGRGKVVWTMPDGTKITFEQHPYHPNAPDWHQGPHYHVDPPGGPPHQRFLPGDPIPGK